MMRASSTVPPVPGNSCRVRVLRDVPSLREAADQCRSLCERRAIFALSFSTSTPLPL